MLALLVLKRLAGPTNVRTTDARAQCYVALAVSVEEFPAPETESCLPRAFQVVGPFARELRAPPEWRGRSRPVSRHGGIGRAYVTALRKSSSRAVVQGANALPCRRPNRLPPPAGDRWADPPGPDARATSARTWPLQRRRVAHATWSVAGERWRERTGRYGSHRLQELDRASTRRRAAGPRPRVNQPRDRVGVRWARRRAVVWGGRAACSSSSRDRGVWNRSPGWRSTRQ